jgi:hypothetical protein
MNQFFTNIFGPSWRTTLWGYVIAILVAVADFFSANGDISHFKKEQWLALAAAVGIAVKGHFEKDKNVSNAPAPLTVAQPVDPPKT